MITIDDFLRLLGDYHPESFIHCGRVERLCQSLGEHLKLSAGQQRRLQLAGRVHDLGKLLVPLEILTSQEPLDDFGVGEIQKHPLIGSLIAELCGEEETASLVLTHHEPGYRRKLVRKGEEETELKHLLALADRFDALRSSRSYKPPYNEEECRRILLKEGFEEGVVNFLITLPGGSSD